MTLWKYRKKGSNHWVFTRNFPIINLADIEYMIVKPKVRIYGEM